MGKVKLPKFQKHAREVEFEECRANFLDDNRKNCCIMGIASPSPAGNGTGSILLRHNRWWKTDVLKQNTAHRTCGDVVANQFLDQL